MRKLSFAAVRIAIFSIGAIAFPVLAPAGADPGDEVGPRLANARESYEKALKELAATALKSLRAARDAATRAGDLDQVNSLRKEIENCERLGDVPARFQTKEYRRKREKARGILAKAYEDAVADYTRARRFEDATSVRKALATRKALWQTVSYIGGPGYWGDVNGWTHDGEDLVMSDPSAPPGGVNFFKEPMNRYTLKMDVKVVGGTGQFSVVFHNQHRRQCAFVVGANDRKRHFVGTHIDGQGMPVIEMKDPPVLPYNQWVQIGLIVDGTNFQCFIDGRKCIEGSDERFDHGVAGLYCDRTSLHIRNLEIRSANDRLLFKGLLELPHGS